eukprot:14444389-Heterocapsa_arctica.AAC.1
MKACPVGSSRKRPSSGASVGATAGDAPWAPRRGKGIECKIDGAALPKMMPRARGATAASATRWSWRTSSGSASDHRSRGGRIRRSGSAGSARTGR